MKKKNLLLIITKMLSFSTLLHLAACGDSGESSTSIEAPETQKNTASIAGRYYIDENNNGKNDDESGYKNAVVSLYKVDGATEVSLTQTQTSANGDYSFINLGAGIYKVKFSLSSAEYKFFNVDLQGETTALSLTKDQQIKNIDMGIVDVPPISANSVISGRYFMDINKNGLDDSEQGISNVLVWLINENNEVIQQQLTDSNGYYSFTQLAANYYIVRFKLARAEHLFSEANQGQNGEMDSQNDSDVVRHESNGYGYTELILVGEQQTIDFIDAGVEVKTLDLSLNCVETYQWPTAPSEAILSNNYSITFTQDGKTIPTQVIMSESKDIELVDSWVSEFKGGRTFNWASLSSNFCSPITVTLTKLFGTGTQDVEIVPSPFSIIPHVSTDGKSVSFTIDKPQYVAVNFKSQDNKQTSDGVVKHMFVLFADPEEEIVPDTTDESVHVYNINSTKADMDAATTIYFPAGYHDLSRLYHDTSVDITDDNVWFGETVSNLGASINKDGKQIYFAGGAYVHGRIYSKGYSNVKIFGRGVLSGRDFKWSKHLKTNNGVLGVDSYPTEKSLIGFSQSQNNSIEGVAVVDSAGHGVNLNNNSLYSHFKLWGWHANNDGARPWGGNNIIKNSFFHAVDDALYNKGLTVTETVFWHGHNGAILTLGWDGNYNTENSTFINNYVIYPEWRSLGNNNGIVMSQIDFDMFGTNVLIRNMHIDGNIPGLVNLHNNSNKLNNNELFLDNKDANRNQLGHVKGVYFENVTVTGKQLKFDGSGFTQTPSTQKGLIAGTVLSDGTIYKMSDIHFENVSIDGECLTENNKNTYTEIDGVTTENIKFDGCNNTFTLTVSSNNGGSISPLSGKIVILNGRSQVFNFEPKEGYAVADVIVDGVSTGKVLNYTFNNVDSDHSLTIRFEEKN